MRVCREFSAYPEALFPPEIASFEALPPPQRAPRPASASTSHRTRHPVRAMRAFALAPALRWDHPLAVGALLIAAPPIGVAVLWASPRFAFAAKLAVTLFAAFTLMLAAIVAITAILIG